VLAGIGVFGLAGDGQHVDRLEVGRVQLGRPVLRGGAVPLVDPAGRDDDRELAPVGLGEVELRVQRLAEAG
jgi:hypothetical protein